VTGRSFATNSRASATPKSQRRRQPISNGARNLWITETALATALNVSYMAEQISIFSIVVGVALILTGIGLVILAFAVFGRYGSRNEAIAG
jgi:hypothetical protein